MSGRMCVVVLKHIHGMWLRAIGAVGGGAIATVVAVVTEAVAITVAAHSEQVCHALKHLYSTITNDDKWVHVANNKVVMRYA